MTGPLDDTIAAIASPPGGAARGIVRISGPQTAAILDRFFSPFDRAAWTAADRPRVFCGQLHLCELGSPLPCSVYLWPTARSYTGGPSAEIHTFGSQPLLEMVLDALCRAGCRLAEPGEFTLRAFLSGRIDLTQAEAVLAAVDAQDDDSLDVALRQLAGSVALPLQQLRNRLLDVLAHLEAGFDFADEDLPFITPEQLGGELAGAREEVEQLARQMELRHAGGPCQRVVLIGQPNTGKSSLFNALLGRLGAIVSASPGTTRDYLTAEIDLDGVGCLLVDTAGLQTDPVNDPVARAAQAATEQERRQARVQLLCVDGSRKLDDWERTQLAENVPRRLVVITKADLPQAIDYSGPAIRTSSISGQGLDALRHSLRKLLLAAGRGPGQVVGSTASRCRESLRLAAESLRRAESLLEPHPAEELIATELRIALEELGKVVGAVYTDDILDRVFSRFCVGK